MNCMDGVEFSFSITAPRSLAEGFWVPRSLQGLPPRCYTGDDTVRWISHSLLTLRLEGSPAADVAVAGAPPLRNTSACCAAASCAGPTVTAA